MISSTVRIGENGPYVEIQIAGYVHPEVAEPEGMDLLDCFVHVAAPPVDATFPVSIRVDELRSLRTYLEQINSGNGPPGGVSISGGLFDLSFAPTRRGPVLCAVGLKSIEAAHVRLEFLVTLEPEEITKLINDLAALDRAAAE
ncbi:MAG TPA: hypothetical protein VMF11_11890 [Candidatus Baltobacteraceae bacterium]|nr:hypothetical protein [Candidatus Baltobacteraceae bacterium]